jgi:hypothetical protein
MRALYPAMTPCRSRRRTRAAVAAGEVNYTSLFAPSGAALL